MYNIGGLGLAGGEEITCIFSTSYVVLIGMERLCVPQTAQFWSEASWWGLN